jgi:hypothetical protein
MKLLPTAWTLGATFALCAPAHGHHSWSANYDLSESRRISGTIARVIFQSPHVAIVIDVETESGRQERWKVEWGSPQRLRERGVTDRTLRPGDRVWVTGHPHRNPTTKSLHVESLHRPSDGLQVGFSGGVGRASAGRRA